MQMNPDEMTLEGYFEKCFKRSIKSRNELSNNIVKTKFTMAAHWLISREALLKVGLFSPIFFHYGEDNNYLHRVKYFGFDNGVCTRAKAVHDVGVRTRDRQGEIYMIQNSALKYSADINIPFIFALAFSRFALLRDAIKFARRIDDQSAIRDCLTKRFNYMDIYRDRRKNKKSFSKQR